MNGLSTLRNNLPILILAALVVVASLLSPSFLTWNNIINLVQYNAELALVCLGLTLVIISGNGGIDLSVGATLGLSGVVVAMYGEFLGLPGSLIVALAVGALVGLANGLAVTKGKLEPFIATFIMASIVTAITLLFTGGGPVLRSIPDAVEAIAGTRLSGIPLPAIYFVLTFLVGVVILRMTPYGRHLYAMGASSETVRFAGIRTDRLRIATYMLCGALAGLAGLLTTARLGMGEPRSGIGMELTAISAVVVGGVSLYGGRGTMTGAFVGILIFAVVLNLMNILNLSAFYQPIAQGSIVILAGLLLSRRKSMFLKVA
ncbi:ABC transporter permease [Pelagibacterium mangrovi]|uniref:ABC transporter permease n=1 Tax=Pelagibacterium mangrovi TaxID=3119828 RepID=UPI002FCC5932